MIRPIELIVGFVLLLTLSSDVYSQQQSPAKPKENTDTVKSVPGKMKLTVVPRPKAKIPPPESVRSPALRTTPIPAEAEGLPPILPGKHRSTLTHSSPTIALPIAITFPKPGAALNRPDTVVTGQYSGVSGEVAVSVNGRFAMVNAQDFAINDVDLVIGSNAIDATITTPTGASYTTGITVQSNNQDYYVRLTSDKGAGLSPMTALLNLEGIVPAAVTNITLQVNSTNYGSQFFPLQLTMNAPGMYLATATVYTSDGGQYQGQKAMSVFDRLALEVTLKQKWDGMKVALLAGNMDGAISYFTVRSQEDYRAILTNLQPQLPQLFGSLEGFNLVLLKNSVAEAEAVRTESGTLFSYPIMFQLDENGEWKIDSF